MAGDRPGHHQNKNDALTEPGRQNQGNKNDALTSGTQQGGDRAGHHHNKNEDAAQGQDTQLEADQTAQANSTPSPQHQPETRTTDNAQVDQNTTPSPAHQPQGGPVQTGQSGTDSTKK